MILGSYCVWPHDGTHQPNERCTIIRGSALNGEELRLLLRAVVVQGLFSLAAVLVRNLPWSQ